jgi:hypothetical protein
MTWSLDIWAIFLFTLPYLNRVHILKHSPKCFEQHDKCAFLTKKKCNWKNKTTPLVYTSLENAFFQFYIPHLSYCEPEQRNRYSDWLRPGRLRDRTSSPGRVKNFLFSTSSRPALRPNQLSIQRVPGALSPGVRQEGRDADHSPAASAEVKRMWMYISTHPYAFTLPFVLFVLSYLL